jgi:surface polysaccharide O-acyltransferase-like enzyme
MDNSRQTGIDGLKLLFSLLVVVIHVFPYSGVAEARGFIYYELVNGISRIAVPGFFVISGYYLNRIVIKGGLKAYLKKILLLFLFWQAIYAPFTIILLVRGQATIVDAFMVLIFGYWHLWYLIALFVGVVLFVFIRGRAQAPAAQARIACLLYLLGYAFQLGYNLGLFSSLPLLQEACFSIGSGRNGVFFAFPLLVFGDLINKSPSSFSRPMVLVALFIGVGLEALVYYSISLSYSMDLYLFATPLAIGIVAAVLKTGWSPNTRINPRASLGIYLLHPVAIYGLNKLAIMPASYEMRYLVVVIATVAIWWGLDRFAVTRVLFTGQIAAGRSKPASNE